MSEHNQTAARSARERKRAEFSGSERSGSKRKQMILLALLFAVLGVGGYFAAGNSNGQAAPAKPVNAVPGPAAVKIPLAELDGGKAKFFDYKTTDNKNIRFFAMKSSDGVYRAAFDACDVCYPARKGYAQDGDEMVCHKCGRRFPSTKINVITGGCNPAALTRTVADGHLVISAGDLEAGKSYF